MKKPHKKIDTKFESKTKKKNINRFIFLTKIITIILLLVLFNENNFKLSQVIKKDYKVTNITNSTNITNIININNINNNITNITNITNILL